MTGRNNTDLHGSVFPGRILPAGRPAPHRKRRMSRRSARAFRLGDSLLALTLVVCGGLSSVALAQDVTLTVHNPLAEARVAETVSVPWAQVTRLAPGLVAAQVRVVDAAGDPVVTQAVDQDADGATDLLLFQTDLAPSETKSFRLRAGEPTAAPSRVFGRFVPERYDDFAWENDRVAFRMYGKALETNQAEPLTSSGVDVWCKRTRELIINKWYKAGTYHTDHGEGLDAYSVGTTRGCGGLAIVRDGKRYVSRNFRNWRLVSNGPLRVEFVLSYEPWDAGGVRISEEKRISLDAGQNLSHFQSTFKTDPPGARFQVAVGIAVHQPTADISLSPDRGTMRVWEDAGKAGKVGCSGVFPQAILEAMNQDAGHVWATLSAQDGMPVGYWAGFGWDHSGDFADMAAWDRYLAGFAQRVRNPVEVSVTAG